MIPALAVLACCWTFVAKGRIPSAKARRTNKAFDEKLIGAWKAAAFAGLLLVL
jgi:hypothetical protein